MKNKRARNNDLRLRIELVKQQMLTGIGRHLLVEMCVSKWGVTNATAYRYLRQAEEEIQEVVHGDRQRWLAEHVAIRRDIRRRANKKEDLRMELDAANSEAKLLGLEAHKAEEGSSAITEFILKQLAMVQGGSTIANTDVEPVPPTGPTAVPQAAGGSVPE